MLVNKNQNDEENVLENIVFKNIKLCKTAHEYLIFMFGYNDKIFMKDKTYHLSFV